MSLIFFQINGGNIEKHTVQSVSNNIRIYLIFIPPPPNFMQKCRTIELSDYRAVGLSIRTLSSEKFLGKTLNPI